MKLIRRGSMLLVTCVGARLFSRIGPDIRPPKKETEEETREMQLQISEPAEEYGVREGDVLAWSRIAGLM